MKKYISLSLFFTLFFACGIFITLLFINKNNFNYIRNISYIFIGVGILIGLIGLFLKRKK